MDDAIACFHSGSYVDAYRRFESLLLLEEEEASVPPQQVSGEGGEGEGGEGEQSQLLGLGRQRFDVICQRWMRKCRAAMSPSGIAIATYPSSSPSKEDEDVAHSSPRPTGVQAETNENLNASTSGRNQHAGAGEEKKSKPKPKQAQAQKKAVVPRSAKDWDAIAAALDEDSDEEENAPKGDDALNKLFREIYSKADEDTRRAMNKSFVESSGTCLSTNWSEIGAKSTECKPPQGMVAKQYQEQ